MQKSYSQGMALRAILRAGFQGTLKNPSSIFFSLLFPLIFVFVFGSFGDKAQRHFQLSPGYGCDTTSLLFSTLRTLPFINIVKYPDTATQRKELEKGNITAVFNIEEAKGTNDGMPHFKLKLISTTASGGELSQLSPLIELASSKLERGFYPTREPLVKIVPQIYAVREYRQIDFILPGQIGFSLLFSTLFGIAFTFYNLREQLVLKRFYATPVNKLNILAGIGFSRLFFQIINVIVLMLVGRFFLHFTLANGIYTFLEIMALSLTLLFLLMGVGLIFSSIAKSDTVIPLFINLFTLPQLLLAGTFFPISVFPEWLQTCTKVFPMTHFNIAIRKISFEGSSLIDCWPQMAVLFVWIAIAYAIVWKFFKWE